MDERLSAQLEAREAEGSHARMLFTPDEVAKDEGDTGNSPEAIKPAGDRIPTPVNATPSEKTPPAEASGNAPVTPQPATPVMRVTTVPLTRPRPVVPASGATAVAAATDVSAVTSGGTAQELAQQPVEADQNMLPAGMNEDGVIEDMQAYDAWLEGEQIQRDMQRREEVNINHSRSEQMISKSEETSDDVDWVGKVGGERRQLLYRQG